MKRFEYKIVTLETNWFGSWLPDVPAEFESLLKTYGDDGWELVQYFPCTSQKTRRFLCFGFNPTALRLVFKRELE